MPSLSDHIQFLFNIFALLLGFTNLIFLTIGIFRYKNVYLKYFWIAYLATTAMLISCTLQFFIDSYTVYNIDFNHVVFTACMSPIILFVSLLVMGLLYENWPKWVRFLICFISGIPIFYALSFIIFPKNHSGTVYFIVSLEFYIMLGLNCIAFLIGFNRLDSHYKKLSKQFSIVLSFFVLVFITQIVFDINFNPLPFYYSMWSIILIVYFWKYIFVVALNRLSAVSVIDKYHITEREKEIMDLIVQGKSNKSIGEQLFISEKTVKNHIYNIYKKIGINSRFELMGLYSSENSEK